MSVLLPVKRAASHLLLTCFLFAKPDRPGQLRCMPLLTVCPHTNQADRRMALVSPLAPRTLQ